MIGGSSGIGLATARLAHDDGAKVIITARDPDRVQRPGLEIEASIAALDATDFHRLETFFDELRAPIDHVLVTGPVPHDMPLAGLDVDKARRDLEAHLLLPCRSHARHRTRSAQVEHCCSPGRSAIAGPSFISEITAALSATTKSLASELAPIRVNLIAAGFVDTPMSAAMLGDRLSARRQQLETTLPIRRVIGPADIAALAVHLMTNTAVTAATFVIDGGQQLIER